MTNREMLQLAAKAAGIDYHATLKDGTKCIHDGRGYWNPLTDDGDALRLAVKLSISFSDDCLYPNGERVVRVGCVYGDTLYGAIKWFAKTTPTPPPAAQLCWLRQRLEGA